MEWKRPVQRIAAMVVIVIAVESLVTMLEAIFRVRFPGDFVRSVHIFLQVMLVVMSLWVGLDRARRHPFTNIIYTWWLQMSPWTIRQRLPVGTIFFNWQDAVVLLVGMLLATRVSLDPLYLPIAYVGGYVLASVRSLYRGGRRVELWLIAYLVPLAIFCIPDLRWVFAFAAVVCGIAHVGMRMTLVNFDRPLLDPPFAVGKLGWTFDRLSANDVHARASFGIGILSGLLAGWWIFVLCVLDVRFGEKSFRVDQAWLFAGLAGFLTSFIRWAVYCSEYPPPFGFVTRLLTGNFILRRYDHVFIAPMLALTAAIALPRVLIAFELPPALVFSVPAAVAVALAIEIGPTLRNWRLTGAHRIVPVRENASRGKQAANSR